MSRTDSMSIKVGTSGYSFADWVGPFYPACVAKGKMLDFYVQHFSTVEINSTYYRIPHPAVMRNIERKTPDGFEFIVKAHRSFTHDRAGLDQSTPEFLASVTPMAETGKLKGLLAQFPSSFRFNDANLDYVTSGAALFAPIPLFVEYRHDSWLDPSVKTAMQQAGIGYCNVDEPRLAHLLPSESAATTDVAYVRLHGRNGSHWWSGGPLRYDYSYSDQELQEWAERMDLLREKASKIYVFFNNCHLGQAVKDAQRFLQMMAR
ncbi:MAG: DUF72 domain-containing protein [candidate division Zixibacteria bacterium]|nr:DUF72 domain-containing protein [candidate division Zixibacteria bacterium]